jgi:hypothetical protein
MAASAAKVSSAMQPTEYKQECQNKENLFFILHSLQTHQR